MSSIAISSDELRPVTGHDAEVEVSKTHNRLDQEVEVSVSNFAPGATYTVVIDANQEGTFQANQNAVG